MLRLLLYDYQRATRYYTIYRTFKNWSSDDFTTILLEKLRLLDTTIPEPVTTIPAGTLRLLLTSIGYRAKARKEMRREPPMVPRRPPRSCCWTDPLGVALASNPQTVGADPAGFAWSVVCCTVLHGSITGAHPYIHYYNMVAVLACIASGVALVSGTCWRRCAAVTCSSVSYVVL